MSFLPGYDFVFLFNEDENYEHKCQEQGIFAPDLQTVYKVLGQSESFLHGDRRCHGAPLARSWPSAQGHGLAPNVSSSGGDTLILRRDRYSGIYSLFCNKGLYKRLVYTSLFTCPNLPRAGITSVCHHTWWWWGFFNRSYLKVRGQHSGGKARRSRVQGLLQQHSALETSLLFLPPNKHTPKTGTGEMVQ